MVGDPDSAVRRLLIAGGGVLAFIAATVTSAAHGEDRPFDPYEVRDLAVSALAENAVAAKEKALDQGLVEAAARVLNRIAVDGADIALGAEQAERLLSAYSHSAEQFGPGGYRGTYTFSFSPLLVRGFLARRGIGVADIAAQPVLLIPIVREAGQDRLWEDAAAWADALAARDMAEGLTPIRLPANSARDRAVRLDRLLEADFITLGEFRIRYRAHAAALAILETDPMSEQMAVSLKGSDGAGPIDTAVRIDDGTVALAAATVANLLSARWKSVAAGSGDIRSGAGNSLSVRVLLTGGAAEWADLQARLAESGVIDGVAVEGMGETSGNIVLWYAGRLDALPGRLAEAELDLFEAGGSWLLQAY